MSILFGPFLCEVFLWVFKLFEEFGDGGDCNAAIVEGDRFLCEEEEGAVEVEEVVADG